MSFPDIENCFTDGETVSQAAKMDEDLIGTINDVDKKRNNASWE